MSAGRLLQWKRLAVNDYGTLASAGGGNGGTAVESHFHSGGKPLSLPHE
jgi:hypothetical protein